MSALTAADLCARLYRKLARAFPEEFRRAHADEMTALTDDMIREAAATRGWAGLLPLALRIFGDLVFQIPAQHASDVWSDVRYNSRILRQSPGFLLVSALSLSIGIGIATTMYSQLGDTVFRSVPGVTNPKELVIAKQSFSYPAFEAMRDSSGQWRNLAAYQGPMAFVLNAPGGSERAWGHVISPEYFDVLGTKPQMGRLPSGSAPEVAISHRLWQRKYSGSGEILNRSIRMNGKLYRITGVMPEGFLGASPMFSAADLFVPVTAQPPDQRNDILTNRRVAGFRVIGHLRPGTNKAESQAALDAFLRQQERDHDDPGKENKERRITFLPGGRLVPIRDEDLPVVLGFPVILTGLTMLIGCANVANMLLARAAHRRREFSVRLAVGASRSRLIRLLLTEGVMIALAGGVGGMVFAYWSIAGANAMRPVMPNYVDFSISLDWRAYLFTVAVCVVAGVLFAIVPAFQATRGDLGQALKRGGSSRLPGFRWFSLRNALVLQQVAGSLTLLLLTGFIVLGFERAQKSNIGFVHQNVFTFSIDPVRDGYTPEQARKLLEDLPRDLERVPGIEKATVAYTSPLAMFGGSIVSVKADYYSSDNKTPMAASSLPIQVEKVDTRLFETIRLAVVEGRTFTENEMRDSAAVAVVNRTMATETWKGRSAVGQTIQIEGRKREVIGVVEDVQTGFAFDPKHRGLYLPMTDEDIARPASEGMNLLVRTQPGVDGVTLVRRELERKDANLSVFNAGPVSDQLRNMNYIVESSMLMYGVIGLFGLMLAAVGLAGVTAYAVAQRTKEIGIRIALGASKRNILGIVLREGTWMVALGTLIGFGMSFGTTRAMKTYFSAMAQITKTSMSDPVLLVGSPLLLAGLAMLACYWPARRSLKLDPLSSLREE
jgi:predicted permease